MVQMKSYSTKEEGPSDLGQAVAQETGEEGSIP